MCGLVEAMVPLCGGREHQQLTLFSARNQGESTVSLLVKQSVHDTTCTDDLFSLLRNIQIWGREGVYTHTTDAPFAFYLNRLYRQKTEALNLRMLTRSSLSPMASTGHRFRFITASLPPQDADGTPGTPGYAVAVLSDDQEAGYPFVEAPTSPRYKLHTFVYRADAIAFMKKHPSAEYRGRGPLLSRKVETSLCDSSAER